MATIAPSRVRRGPVASLLVACLVTVATVAAGPAASAAADAAPGSAFVPVAPCRLVDTRDSVDQPGPRWPATRDLDVRVAGRCGVGDDAVAAALVVTVVDPAGPGFATVYPRGDRPGTSTVNYRTGEVVANLQLTRLAQGAVQVHSMAATHLVVDVTGWFRPAGSAGDDGSGRYVALAPERVVDTRAAARPAPRTAVRVETGVPDGAVAVAVNLTTAETEEADVFTVYAAGTRRPSGSVLNVDRPDQMRAASVLVPVRDGEFDVYTAFGNHVIVDLLGYFTGPTDDPGDAGLFVPVEPFRLVDTRAAAGPAGGPRLWDGGAREWGMPHDRLAATDGEVGALALNVTVTGTEDPGFVSLAAARTEPTGTSTVNYSTAQQTVANAAIVGVSGHGIQAAAHEATHLVVDATGWFTGAPVAATTGAPVNRPPADRKVTIITDSAFAGVRWSGGLPGLQGFVADHRMESCRRLVAPSCRGREGYRPRTVVSELATLTGVGPEDIVVIATGYDDWWQSFDRDFDTVVTAARAAGFHHIVWTTFRTDVSYHGLGAYYALMNEVLRAKEASGRYPDVRIWDYAGYTASAPGWFTSDGIHLTRLGAFGTADWISRQVRAFDDRACPQPWAPGGGVDDPCPDPDPLPAVRGLPDIAGLYAVG